MPDAEQDIRSRAFWSGTVTFGMVSIPVGLFPGNRSRRISLRMLAPDGTPLNRRYYCPAEGKPVDREDIVRGYEVEKGKFVVIDDDELEALQPKKSREIDLRRFVPVEQIDPSYFNRAYFLAPTGDSQKPYRLLAEAMERTARAGIATFVMRGKEYLVAILAENGILRAETLRFADEIRAPEDVGLSGAEMVDESRAKFFAEEIRAAAADDLEKEALRDEYAEKLLELVKRKRSRREDVIPASRIEANEKPGEPEEGEVIDIMDLLKRSLEETGSEETPRLQKEKKSRRRKKG